MSALLRLRPTSSNLTKGKHIEAPCDFIMIYVATDDETSMTLIQHFGHTQTVGIVVLEVVSF